MALNFYQAPQPEPLSSAYQMLLQAELAKADAMGRLFDPLTKAIQGNKELALQREALDVRRQESAADADWKQRYGDLQTRGMDINEKELGLKERKLDEDAKGRAAFAKAYMGSQGGGAYSPSTSTDGSVGGGGGPMGSAGGAAPTYQPRHVDPELAAQMEPELLMAFERYHDMQEDNARQAAEQQRKVKQGEEMRGSFTKTIERGAKEGWIKPTEVPMYQARLNNPQDYDAIGKELSGKADKYITDTEDTRSYTTQYKDLRKTVESDKEIDPARKSDLLKQMHAIDIGNASPKDKSKALAEAYGKTYDPNRTKEKADKGPFKYLEDDPHYAKGGVIEQAPETTRANVQLQAMTMAAQNGLLRKDVIELASGNPNFDRLATFYDKMDAAEREAVQTFESLIWKRAGWVPAEQAEADAINRLKSAPKEGLPYNEGLTIDRPAAAVGPANPSPTQSASLLDLAPEQRAEALKIHKSGDREALKAFLLKARGGAYTGGPSVMDKPTTKPKSERLPGGQGPF